MSYHLAQLNIARAKTDIDDPAMNDFMNALDHINGLAESSPGFVWRLQTEEGNAMSLRPFDDDRMVVNLSTWESVEQLRAFAYKGEHLDYFRCRAEWFESLPTYQVLWWVPAGHRPTVEEAKAKLALLEAEGPGEEVFTFARRADPPS